MRRRTLKFLELRTLANLFFEEVISPDDDDGDVMHTRGGGGNSLPRTFSVTKAATTANCISGSGGSATDERNAHLLTT